MDQAPRAVKFEDQVRRRESANRTRPRGPYMTQDETGGSLANPPKARSPSIGEPRGPYQAMDESGGQVNAS